MTETMSNETFDSQESEIAAEMRSIAQDILAVVPEATDTKRLSSVEANISEGIRIILAHRKNDDPADSDFIVSQVKSTPGQSLQRETYRWSSAFPESEQLQVYETVMPGAEGKPRPAVRKGFKSEDIERLRELVTAAGNHERA